MKNNIILPFFFAVAAVALFSSCEKDAEVDLPETKPKLVVTSYITPQDTVLKVVVTRSRPIFESYDINTASTVANATVMMMSSTGSVQLTYDVATEYYTAPVTALPIIAGNTYSLTVTTPGGESVEASTTVPAYSVQGFSVSMDDSLFIDQWYTHLITNFDYRLNDNGGEQNMYRFFSALVLRDTIVGDTTIRRFTNELFTDYNGDGQQLQRSIETNWGFFDPSDPYVLIGYDCWIFNVDIHYYNFHNSFDHYTGDDPFSEPTIIYTNIKNGLGVFASANGTKVRVYR